MDTSFQEYLTHAWHGIWSITEVGVLLLCLGLWLNRKRPRNFLKSLKPESFLLNITVATIDILFISIPLNLVVFRAFNFLELHKLILFPALSEAELPSFTLGLSAIFIGDLIAYWRHRLEHVGWLWKSHAMHHSDADMNWTTNYRFHPINRLTTALIDMSVLLIIGFPLWTIVLNGVIRHYYGAFVHINQPWTLGLLGKILVSPAMHRWHHALEGRGVGRNFASVFSVFDRWFGTHYCPGPCHVPLGVHCVRGTDLLGQYLLPFRLKQEVGRGAADAQSRTLSRID